MIAPVLLSIAKSAPCVVGKAVGKGISCVDVDTRCRSNRRAIRGVFGDCQGTRGDIGRSIVGTLNGDRDLGGAGKPRCIAHRISKDILQRITGGAQCLNGCVTVVDGVGVPSIAGNANRSIRTRDTRTDRPDTLP